MRDLLTKNHLTIKKIFNKFLTQPRKALEKMTGYQKLKKENELLWTAYKNWLYVIAGNYYKEDNPKYEEFVKKEIAYMEKVIKDETK